MKIMKLSNTPDEHKYSWDDSIEFLHSDGQSFSVPLSSVKNTDYVGYLCSSCKSPTTLADGKCGSCGNPFEPLDIREAKELFPSVQVREKNPDRVAFLLLHRAWVCNTCNSYNVNYPRTGGAEGVSCINCGNHYDQSADILLDDGDILTEWVGDPVANFRNKILEIIERRRPRRVKQSSWWIATVSYRPVSQSWIHKDDIDTNGWEQTDTVLSRNKWKILIWNLSMALIYMVYYGFIEEIGTEIQVAGHEWERVIHIEGYREQTGSGWEKDINPNSYAEFLVTNRSMREAPWTWRQIQIGTKSVTDYWNCTATHKSCTSSKTTTSTGVTIEWPKSCTESCTKYGTKQEPVMKTIYENKPYLKYRYMDWVVVSSPKSIGTDKKPHWPETNWYNLDGSNQRLGTRNESYKITVTPEDGKTEKLSVPFDTWNKLSESDRCPANATRWWGVVTKSITQRISECLRK